MKKLDYIDALRGVAVLLVIAVHFGLSLSKDSPYAHIARFGQYGVQLFFVLSAFTLCLSLKKAEGNSPVTYAGFMVRRFFRIAPLYYAAILAYFVFTFASFKLVGVSPFTAPRDYTLGKVASNLLFVHGLYPPGNNTIVPGGWSIGCEFLFYAMFPFLFFSARRQKSSLVYFGVVALLITVGIAMLRLKSRDSETPFFGNNSFVYYSVFNEFACFAIGMFYFFYAEEKVLRTVVLTLSPICAILLALTIDSKWGWLFSPALAGIVSVSLILWTRNLSINRLLKKVGELSFSIYICHFVAVWAFQYIWHKKVQPTGEPAILVLCGFVTVVAAAFAMSCFTNRFIELPFIDLGHKISKSIQSSREGRALGFGLSERSTADGPASLAAIGRSDSLNAITRDDPTSNAEP